MYIDELRNFKEKGHYSPENVAEKLLELSNLTNDESVEEIKNDLENALYHLSAIAENKYNKDYFRTFYNALLVITGFKYF